MMEMKRILFMAACAALAGAILFPVSVLRAQGAAGGYRVLSPPEAREMIVKRAGDARFVLLDVRTPEEFRAGRIEGAVLIDYLAPSFLGEVSKLDRGKSYLVYCRTGHRSNGAVKAMRDLGFGDVSELAGGITKWKEAGLPVAR